MRIQILEQNRRALTRSAAILMVSALMAGCSSSAMRFDDFTDGILTGSTENQRRIIGGVENQPFPGDVMATAPVNGVTPAQGALAPMAAPGTVQRSALPAASVVSAPPALDQTATGATVRDTSAQPGIRRAGGSEIAIQPGDTIYSLSQRFGVSADAIMNANGISDPTGLHVGRKIVIPAQGAEAAVSAPAQASGAPQPDQTAPVKQAAVLPQTPKLKEPQSGSEPTASRASSASSGSYTVVAGDTLFGIARKTGASAEAIKSANGLSDGFIRIGQVLTIPVSGAKVAQAAQAQVDPLPTAATVKPDAPRAEAQAEPAAYTPPVSKEKLVEQVALNPSVTAPDSTGIGRMRWPVRGRVIAGFGGGKGNDGIDIAVPEGTPIKAAENGVVIYAGDGLKEFGNTVLVRHEDGLVTVYGHASEINVARGDTVRRGEEIARSGMSGSAETPQLHFEVRKDSAPVDPITFLE